MNEWLFVWMNEYSKKGIDQLTKQLTNVRMDELGMKK